MGMPNSRMMPTMFTTILMNPWPVLDESIPMRDRNQAKSRRMSDQRTTTCLMNLLADEAAALRLPRWGSNSPAPILGLRTGLEPSGPMSARLKNSWSRMNFKALTRAR